MEPDLEKIRVENEVALRKARRYTQFLHDLELYERAITDEEQAEEIASETEDR